MNIQDEYLTLECPNCKGKLERVNSDLFVAVNSGFVFIGGDEGERLECQHCGTVLQRRQQVKPYQSSPKYSINIGNITNASGVVIGDGATVTQTFYSDGSFNIKRNK
jgi:hypothetical protein